MASWEKLLKPKFDAAVPYTADLIEDAAILDKLLARNVLSSERYEKLSQRSSDPKKAARSLLLSLQVGTKFETFLGLLPDVEGGKELLNELTTSEAQEKETASRTAKEAVQPNVETDSETDSDSDSDCAEDEGRTILTVQVLRKYKKQYKEHKDSFRSTIKRTFRKVYKERVEVDEAYPKKLHRSFHSAHVAVRETVIFRIVFPRLSNGQVFERHRQRIVRDLAGAMGILENQVEIFAFDGSCILSIAIPGDGFIRFVAALDVPGRLDFLYTVDDEVIVKIDELPEFSLKTLHGPQDEKALKFPNRDDENLNLLFSKEESVVGDEMKVLHSLNIDAKKKPIPKKEFLSTEMKSAQSRSKDASKKTFQAYPKIASAISDTFIPNVIKDEGLLSKLGSRCEQILEVMQQTKDSCFTTEQIARIHHQRSSRSVERGRTLLRCVDTADDQVKTNFVISLFAVDSHFLAFVSSNLHDEVSKSVAKEFARIGGATIQKEAFRRALKNNLLDDKRKEIAVLVIGKAGAGKSTLIDVLTGGRAATVGVGARTFESYRFRRSEENLPLDLVLWNTPGLHQESEEAGYAEERTKRYLKKMADQVKEVDLVIFCVDVCNPCHSKGVSSIIDSVTVAFSNDIWQHCMFAFTKANMLRGTDDENQEAHFQNVITSVADGLRKLLLRHKINQEVIDSIPCVPVGSARDRVLSNGKPWLPNFWVTAMERATVAGSSFLLMNNLTFGSNKKRKNSAIILS